MMETVAAALVGAALLWLVVQPLVAPATMSPEVEDIPDPEDTPQGQALLALKEIEFDRATGKLSDTDFTALHAKYSAAAIASLDAAKPRPGGLRCRTHGAAATADARYCAECGAGLVTETGACAACHAVVPPDARFCPGCGVMLS
jgi:hypothetical protein